MTDFAKYISDNKTVFKYAKGKSIEDGKEFHSFYEIVYFIDGNAEFVSEDISVKLTSNTVILIPKEHYHQFIFEQEESYHRCIFNFPENDSTAPFLDSCFEKISIVKADKQIESFFKSLIDLSLKEVKNQIKAKVMSSTLTLLLFALSEIPNSVKSGNRFHPITKQILAFTEEHLSENISLSDIAAALNVSVSTLSHTFKQDMRIPLYKFIQEKRLMNASRLINAGTPPTIAAANCGFSDYSGFYRQYKAMFDRSPSDTETQ